MLLQALYFETENKEFKSVLIAIPDETQFKSIDDVNRYCEKHIKDNYGKDYKVFTAKICNENKRTFKIRQDNNEQPIQQLYKLAGEIGRSNAVKNAKELGISKEAAYRELYCE